MANWPAARGDERRAVDAPMVRARALACRNFVVAVHGRQACVALGVEPKSEINLT
jgi:hypothetical protein